jgi:hypothetical protein
MVIAQQKHVFAREHWLSTNLHSQLKFSKRKIWIQTRGPPFGYCVFDRNESNNTYGFAKALPSCALLVGSNCLVTEQSNTTT